MGLQLPHGRPHLPRGGAGGVKLSPLQQYGIVTASYWAFTLTDGAPRMLVVLSWLSSLRLPAVRNAT